MRQWLVVEVRSPASKCRSRRLVISAHVRHLDGFAETDCPLFFIDTAEGAPAKFLTSDFNLGASSSHAAVRVCQPEGGRFLPSQFRECSGQIFRRAITRAPFLREVWTFWKTVSHSFWDCFKQFWDCFGTVFGTLLVGHISPPPSLGTDSKQL